MVGSRTDVIGNGTERSLVVEGSRGTPIFVGKIRK